MSKELSKSTTAFILIFYNSDSLSRAWVEATKKLIQHNNKNSLLKLIPVKNIKQIIQGFKRPAAIRGILFIGFHGTTGSLQLLVEDKSTATTQSLNLMELNDLLTENDIHPIFTADIFFIFDSCSLLKVSGNHAIQQMDDFRQSFFLRRGWGFFGTGDINHLYHIFKDINYVNEYDPQYGSFFFHLGFARFLDSSHHLSNNGLFFDFNNQQAKDMKYDNALNLITNGQYLKKNDSK